MHDRAVYATTRPHDAGKVGPADTASLDGGAEHGLVVDRIPVCGDSRLFISPTAPCDVERPRGQIRGRRRAGHAVADEAVARGPGRNDQRLETDGDQADRRDDPGTLNRPRR